MESGGDAKPAGCLHLLLLQGGHRAAHPLSLCLDFWGLLPRGVPVLAGDRFPPLDPTSRRGEMESLEIVSQKTWGYKFAPRAAPTQRPAKFIWMWEALPQTVFAPNIYSWRGGRGIKKSHWHSGENKGQLCFSLIINHWLVPHTTHANICSRRIKILGAGFQSYWGI